MQNISSWINFNGNAKEAFDFYKSVFGGKFTKVIHFKDIAGPEFPVQDADANKLMQIVLSVGSTQMLIGNDVPEFMGKVSENENRSKIHVGADSKEEAEKLFNGLSVGGKIEMSDSVNEKYFGMFRDKYGIEWIIEFNPDK